MVLLEGLGKLKRKSSVLIEIRSATFRLVAHYLNQLRYRVPDTGFMVVWNISIS
jgi:hypothetical protein